MDWFFRRFRGGNRARAALVCYLRENGPIAYGTDTDYHLVQGNGAE